MTIGLLLLAIVAILIFFGVSERFFRSLGVSNWLAFVLVLALVIGAVIPSFSIGGVFSLNLGGFVVPLVIMTVLMVVMHSGKEVVRALLGVLSVAAVAVATRMLIEPGSTGLILASSLIVGFAGGVVAFLVGQTRLATLASAVGGIILGDIAVNFLYVFALGGYEFTLGTYGVFDSIVIASVFGILIFEAASAIKKTAARQTTKRATFSGAGLNGRAVALSESAEDQHFDENRLFTGDADTELEFNSDKDTSELYAGDEVGDSDTESYFDDFI